MLLGQKGDERDEPLRQVHLKVLRNCQVNCAMHARATGAVGSCARKSPAVTAAALVGDNTKLCPLSTPFQIQLHNRANKRLKIKVAQSRPESQRTRTEMHGEQTKAAFNPNLPGGV